MSVGQQKLSREYRVRLVLDDKTVCTITSSNPERMKNNISRLIPSATFQEQGEEGTQVTFKDAQGIQQSTWITAYSIPLNQSVTALHEARQHLQKEVAA